MGAGSRDVIAVWLYEGVIYVGNKRIYDLEQNEGYIIEEWQWFDWSGEELDYTEWLSESKTSASELATRISSEALMPVMAKWDSSYE